jgi:AcrR family transcriptional regulator
MARKDTPPIYDDMPSWPDNRDNLGIRAVNIAWHLMKEKDLAEISFAELAQEAGFSTPSVYSHYATLTDFACKMTELSVRTLYADFLAAYDKAEDPYAAYEAWFQFARKRPRQYELAMSARFKGEKDVAKLRGNLQRDLDLLLKMALDREPKEGELLRMNLILLGGGISIVNGSASVKDLMATVTATIRSWKK